MSPKRIQSDPQWVKGIQSGYDPNTAKWRNSMGKATSRAEAVRSLQEELTMLGGTATFQPDKLSTAAEKIEHLIGGGFNPFSYDDVGKTKANVPHIPGNVLASYRLADFFYQTEGDIAAAVETPIQVAMRDLDINCPDPEVKKELETMYDVDGLDMVDLIQSMWLSMAVFGIAHPFEAWEGSELKGIILLPPMYTSVGNHLSGDFLMPMGDEKQWTREALKSLLPTAMYDAMNRPDETKPIGKLPLPVGMMYSVRGLDQKWRPYPKPWMQGAFRSMNTRIVYEEMRRAVYEGFRHQLWAFLLGDKDIKPTPQMMTKLINDVTGMSGERTGNLCWWGALRIEVHTPKTDNLMSAEEWWMLNLDIFRRLGMSMRVTTGNSYQGERGGSDYTFDVDIMLEKFEFMRKALLRWERGFRLRYAEKTGSEAFKKAARETEVVFALNMMELRKQIQERLVPMFTTGALSVQTLLKRSNENFEVEKANKQALKSSGDDELFVAPATFSQTTVNPDTPEKKSSVTDKGRPADTGKAKKPEVKASEELDRLIAVETSLAEAVNNLTRALNSNGNAKPPETG